MEAMTLKEIAVAAGGELFGEDREIPEIISDTRKIKNGSLFVALVGEKYDGHDFCSVAEENCAAALFVHKKAQYGIPYILVDDTRKAQLRLAEYYRKKFDIPVAGVTGSVGKTTTKEMIYAVLSSKYKTLKTQGNLNNDIGVPNMVFRLDGSYEAAVFEMGMSNAGEISALSETVHPTVAVISNIGVSHMENLGSRENILKAKLEILDGMEKDAPVALNGDDEFLKDVKLPGRRVVYYSVENDTSDYKAENISQHDGETEFDIICKKGRYHAVIPTIGLHNVYDALAGFTVGVLCGIDESTCSEALANYVTTGMRQRIVKHGGITFMEDCYNASPDSQKASINALTGIEAKRHIAVMGDMLELGKISKEAHYSVGEYAAKSNVDILCTYGEQSEYIAQGARDNGMESVIKFTDKEKLSKYLLETLREGDCVSFKASRGMKLEDVIEIVYKGMGIENE